MIHKYNNLPQFFPLNQVNTIFPGPDPTAMFHKSFQQAQMALPVVAFSLSYAPEAALLQLKSLKMLLQYVASIYPTDIPAPNEYVLEYHAEMVQHITGLLQEQSMLPVTLTYLTPSLHFLNIPPV